MSITKSSNASATAPSAAAKEIAADILGMVRHMDLFGSSTRPVRVPTNTALNGTYYTIPVKLTYQNKQTAQRVSELLKGTYKIHTSVPYHKSLRTAIGLVHQRVRQNNPRSQVRVTLDANNKRLKVATRPDTLQPDNKWVPSFCSYPIPTDALNPKLSDPSSIVLPPSPFRLTGENENIGIPDDDHRSFSMSPKPGASGGPPGGASGGVPAAAPGIDPLPLPPLLGLTRRTPPQTRTSTGKNKNP